MALSLYDISIPPVIKGLRNLSAILERGRAHANEAGIAHATMLEARLFADMLPLTGQIQRASDTAKLMAVRIGGVANAPMADTETSFDALQKRIAATIAFLEAVPAQAVEGKEEAEVLLPAGSVQRTYSGRSYVLEFALPNFFFHVTTAYDLLRHNGVPVGKRNYLGWE
ncbi:DUF1993 domain-containing protein [Roseiarcaceae bacterium H3SJ34-1]|uniref:DUF1993 domain-containing protein n=1 Tax=Terripilifer ovatus TaxID=3032367 RepID=UPI003AB9280B|nr:DUF1993 domain-containing protein [Roseiarcaceae bacterium H3SJ34-1]